MDSGYCEPCWAFVAIVALVGAVAIIALLLLGPSSPDAFRAPPKPDASALDNPMPRAVAATP